MSVLAVLGTAFLVAYLLALGTLFLYSAYELWTMPPDAEAWEIYTESEVGQTLEYWWGR